MNSGFLRWVANLKVAVVVATISLAASPVFAADQNEKAIRAANDQFYTALNKLFTGDVSPMEEVWSHADDIVNMGPDGGFQKGWKEVLSIFKEQAAKKLGGKVSPKDVRVIVGKRLAVVHAIESGANKGADSKSLPVSIRVTNVYRLEGKTWKMVAHQTDKLSFLKK